MKEKSINKFNEELVAKMEEVIKGIIAKANAKFDDIDLFPDDQYDEVD